MLLILGFPYLIAKSTIKFSLPICLDNFSDWLSVKYLKGNVEFQKGLVDLKCQYGTYKEKKDIAYLFDEVRLTKETLTLTCDSITFYSEKNRVESTGNPKINHSEFHKILWFNKRLTTSYCGVIHSFRRLI